MEIVGKVRGGHRSRICPARQQIQIAAENKLKPGPEIACCCHRGQFVSTQDLKYGRWWLHGLAELKESASLLHFTYSVQLPTVDRERESRWTVDSRVATSEVAFCADRRPATAS